MDFLKLNVGVIADRLMTHISRKEKMLVLCHKNPDGDTVGSAFALKMIYESLGGEALCLAPSEAPANLKWMFSGQKTLVPEIEGGCFLCAVDVASTPQLGYNADKAEYVDFMIDHHSKGEPFADNLVCPDASATGEIIFALYKEMQKRIGGGMDPGICRRLYGAISSDTGSFRFENTTPETMQIAAELMAVINNAQDGGRSTAEISRILHETVSKKQLDAEKAAIEALTIDCGGKLAYVMFTAEMMEKNELSELDLGKLIDVPRSIEGVLLAVSIKQSMTDKATFFVSSRSNCDISVSEICAALGGGGHDKAAGVTITAGSPQTALEGIIPKFREALK